MKQKTQKNCLVTGATGVVGLPLVNELLRHGHNVAVLARGDVGKDFFSRPVKIIRGDLSNMEALESAAKGAQWIFHLAAKLHISNPDEKLRREYLETNVEGTKNLLHLANLNNVEKFIFFSTINVYGSSRNDEIFDETSKLNPRGLYGETKAAAEKLVLGAENQKNEKIGVCLRLAAVYGSRMKGNYIQLLRALQRGRFFFIGDGSNRRTLIHQADAAEAAILAAEKSAGGKIYNVTDAEVHTFRQIVEAMCAAIGKSPPKFHFPVTPFRLGIGAADFLGASLGLNLPVNSAMLEKLLEDVAVSGRKIQEELGFRPKFDLRKGWQEASDCLDESD